MPPSPQSTTDATPPPVRIASASSAAVAPFAPLLAGMAGGTASTVLLHPLDLVKVRLQVNVNARRRRGVGGVGIRDGVRFAAAMPASNVAMGETAARNSSAYLSPPVPTAAETNPASLCRSRSREQSPRGNVIYHMLRGVTRHEGYAGLYRGLAPAVVGSATSWGGFFILYEDLKQRMLRRKSFREQPGSDGGSGITASLGPSEHFAASCLAGAAMVLLTNPLWLIKTRLQLQFDSLQTDSNFQRRGDNPPYRGAVHAAVTIVRDEGVLALYKGSVPALMLVSHGGIQFVSYEFLKERYGRLATSNGGCEGDDKVAERGERGTIPDRVRRNLGYLVMGAVSKFIASTATYPLQLIKTRLQQRSKMAEVAESGEIIMSKREYSGVVDCVSKTWRNEGAGGFFKGCIPNAIRVAPSAAITFVVYEMVLDALKG